MSLKVELTRFKVKPGKTAVVDQWMKLLNDNMSSVLLTLNDEKMYVETIFREEIEGIEYLYWYSVQGDGGIEVQDSDHEIDKKHLEYWEECIDNDFRPVDLKTEVIMIQDSVLSTMK
ncbi:DUF6176 family protein [Peribacillus butanolivorans]|uniref:DUF6176 family protein n=1 Tax=Peribacillus butanolivorans TaxID=421767 RepID=UPI0035DFEE7B